MSLKLRKSIQRYSFDGHYIPEPMSGCWLWLRKTDRDGYGRIWTGSQEIGAHKWSYEQINGPVVSNLHVLHRCDTPSCVNPRHLFLGDMSINLRDASIKGRLNRRDCRLSETTRKQIVESPLARNATARRFGISPRTVQAIWKRTRHSKPTQDQRETRLS